MSTKAQIQTQGKASPAPTAAHVPQPRVAELEPEADRPDIATQLKGTALLGHSLGAISVNSSAPPIVQRQELPEEEEEEKLQTKTANGVQRQGAGEGFRLDDETAGRINRARCGGQPLDVTLQKQMGETMGHDFSGVQVHTDSEAHTLNRLLSARAFTTGHDIFFQRGEYNPGSGSGRELIAHELTHVVQQSTGRVSGAGSGVTVRPVGDAFEQEADRVAEAITTSTSNSVQVRTTQAQYEEPGLLAQWRAEATPDLAPPPGTLAGQRAVGNRDVNRHQAKAQRVGMKRRGEKARPNPVIQARVSEAVPGGVVQRNGQKYELKTKADIKGRWLYHAVGADAKEAIGAIGREGLKPLSVGGDRNPAIPYLSMTPDIGNAVPIRGLQMGDMIYRVEVANLDPGANWWYIQRNNEWRTSKRILPNRIEARVRRDENWERLSKIPFRRRGQGEM